MKEQQKQLGRPRKQESPRVSAVKRLLNMAQLIRQHGNPEEAAEAVVWEQKLSERLSQVQQSLAA